MNSHSMNYADEVTPLCNVCGHELVDPLSSWHRTCMACNCALEHGAPIVSQHGQSVVMLRLWPSLPLRSTTHSPYEGVRRVSAVRACTRDTAPRC